MLKSARGAKANDIVATSLCVDTEQRKFPNILWFLVVRNSVHEIQIAHPRKGNTVRAGNIIIGALGGPLVSLEW